MTPINIYYTTLYLVNRAFSLPRLSNHSCKIVKLRQIFQRIDRNAVEADFKVQMRTRGEAAGAGGARQTAAAADGLTLLHDLAFYDIYAA